ncbi:MULTISPECIES: glyoxalase [Bacillus]|uniref:glyoxalase n=1 Tax=Bacillus TaxID=1386 RepID=UPI0009B52EA9|nr:glyoxalase [Bacillus pacificus]MCC2419247.1 glyoxalase [Bacillus pacificus]MCU5562608.1 glyoxalase [Bacillus pacificus]MPU17359.1 glyoxalase [Acinetobacter baumannii]
MREAIEELIRGLHESAVDSRKESDKAFDSGDLGLAGYYNGQWHAFEGTAIALEDLLSDHKEETQ